MRLIWRMNAVSDAGNHTHSVHISHNTLLLIQQAFNDATQYSFVTSSKVTFRISNGGLGSAVKLSTLDLNPWRKVVVTHKIVFLKTLRCCLLYLHNRAIELLYKRNITRVLVQYGCISPCCDYKWPNHSCADLHMWWAENVKFFHCRLN